MDIENTREPTLEEFCADAPNGVQWRVQNLLWKEAHPLLEFWRQMHFKFRWAVTHWNE